MKMILSWPFLHQSGNDPVQKGWGWGHVLGRAVGRLP